jgi:hypothetical protein
MALVIHLACPVVAPFLPMGFGIVALRSGREGCRLGGTAPTQELEFRAKVSWFDRTGYRFSFYGSGIFANELPVSGVA